MAIGSLWIANIVLAGANAILLTGLLMVYVRNFREIKSKFALGLLFFAGFLLIENLGSLVMFFDIATEYTADLAVRLLAVNSFQTVGFSVLLWTTLR